MPLPITSKQAGAAADWLMGCFGDEIKAAAFGPFEPRHYCAIACQETAYFWLPRIGKHTPHEILSLCVLDGSGDVLGTVRNAFPKNTAAFRVRYGDKITEKLIAAGNRARAARGLKPWAKIYKGYGIFQYDLQFVVDDEIFFFQEQWGDIRKCIDRVNKELRAKYARHGDLRKAIKAYNGSGPRAEAYAANVLTYAKTLA
jgi:hypothetical protein